MLSTILLSAAFTYYGSFYYGRQPESCPEAVALIQCIHALNRLPGGDAKACPYAVRYGWRGLAPMPPPMRGYLDKRAHAWYRDNCREI